MSMDNTTHGAPSVGQDDAPLTPEQRRDLEEAIHALVVEPLLIMQLFDRAVDAHHPDAPHAQVIVRDYLRVVSSALAKRHEWKQAHPRP